uniref:uncharacterized protein LOC120810681 n=1 Tax=Gasterosteus aculeatus aculeatus TaxID=481459 RepID=UPI001A9A121B|nr:uncharacterized protein LOC120810681 [Gasterosteus aculeatus aculeatus]
MLCLVTLNMIRQTFAVNISILLHQNLKNLQIKLREIEVEIEGTQTKRPHIPNSKYIEQQGKTEKALKKREGLPNTSTRRVRSRRRVKEQGTLPVVLCVLLHYNTFMVPLFLPLPPKVAVKKKNLSKYEEEEEGEVDDEARHDTKNKRAREEEEHIGDEDDKVPASKKKSAAEFRKQLDEQMWERKNKCKEICRSCEMKFSLSKVKMHI